jgi:MFS family permease
MRAVLSHRAFRNLWIGQTLSGVGDSLVIVVIGLYVTDLTGRSTDVGIVLAAYTVPFVGFLLIGGVVADRLPRRAVMIAADAARMAVHALLAVMIALDAAEVWHMVAIGVVFGAGEAFFRPAATGLLPQTVPEELIQEAQALTAGAREASFIAGPALGTALVFSVGAEAAFAFDAGTFAVSIAFLVGVHPRTRGEPHQRSTVLRELREGWSAVRERTWVWATIAAFSICLLTMLAPFFVLGAAVAQERYGDAWVFGATQSVWGCGTLAGALAGLRWRPRFPMRAAMLWALPWPVSLALFAAGAPLPVVAVASLVSGLGIGLFGVWWETALAMRVPPHLLSRVSAYDWMGSLAFVPLGYVLAGVIGDAVGAPATLLAGCAIGLAALALGVLPRETRGLRRIERGDAEAERTPVYE